MREPRKTEILFLSFFEGVTQKLKHLHGRDPDDHAPGGLFQVLSCAFEKMLSTPGVEVVSGPWHCQVNHTLEFTKYTEKMVAKKGTELQASSSASCRLRPWPPVQGAKAKGCFQVKQKTQTAPKSQTCDPGGTSEGRQTTRQPIGPTRAPPRRGRDRRAKTRPTGAPAKASARARRWAARSLGTSSAAWPAKKNIWS